MSLQTELAKAKYDGMTDDEKLAALNAKTEQVAIPIPAIEVKRTLQVRGKWAAIADAVDHEPTATTRIACRALVDAVNDFDSFDMSVPDYATAINAALDAVVATPLLDDDDKAAVLALGFTMKSPAQLAGFGSKPVRMGELQMAEAS